MSDSLGEDYQILFESHTGTNPFNSEVSINIGGKDAVLKKEKDEVLSQKFKDAFKNKQKRTKITLGTCKLDQKTLDQITTEIGFDVGGSEGFSHKLFEIENNDPKRDVGLKSDMAKTSTLKGVVTPLNWVLIIKGPYESAPIKGEDKNKKWYTVNI